MYDKEAIEMLKGRFAAPLGNPCWEELADQILCRFLVQNRTEIEKGKKKWLDQVLKASFLFEKAVFFRFFQKGSALVIGDELCSIPVQKNVNHVHYSEDTCKYFKRIYQKDSSCWDHFVPQKSSDLVFSFHLISWLKSEGRVRELETMMRKLGSCVGKKGGLLILDQQIYQDDFLMHLVSMDYEIVSIEKYAPSHFLIHAKP